MSEDSTNKNDKLFMYLVGTFQSSAWIALGKMKSPVTDKIERNLDQASFYIDLLDMMQTKMEGNLSEYEEQMLINTVSELKMNFIEENKKIDEGADSSQDEAKNESSDQKDEVKPKKRSSKSTKSKSKSTKKKTK